MNKFTKYLLFVSGSVYLTKHWITVLVFKLNISEYSTVITSLCSGVAANSCDDGGVVRGWEGADGNLTSLALS